MAQYQHSYPFDVFISYAWIQGEPDPWVEALHLDLEKALQKISGTKPKIWRDQQQMGAGSVIDAAMLEGVRQSAVLLPVLTPAWVKSTKCQLELAEFSKRLTAVTAGAVTVPVAIVEQLPAKGLPELFQNVLRTKFHRQSKAGNPNPYPPASQTFRNLVNDLAHQIYDVLEKLPKTEIKPDLSQLVQRVRKATYASIKERCGTMKVLDMTEPIDLDSIYTDVNILEIPSHLRASPEDELMQSVIAARDSVNRLSGIHSERIEGFKAVEIHSRLFILGKPGAGKTTFMKRLAFHCAEGKFCEDFIPVFVTLNDWAQDSGTLADFVTKRWGKSASESEAVDLLREGLVFVLLDGLDEVPNEKLKHVRDEVEKFCVDYPKCRIVMTCRIAAQQYNFQKFKDVEMADFNREQIGQFVANWFGRKGNAEKSRKVLADLDSNQSVLELGSSPILLTMLCLLADSGITLTGNRASVYEKGVDVLLQRWDKTRDIERAWPYKRMDAAGRRLLLSDIAYKQFVKGSFFFKKVELEELIDSYFEKRPTLLGLGETFSADSVLRAIESQHGFLVQRSQQFYSFSHLTFQEYLTAKRIHDGQHLLSDLASRVTDAKWREVILLTSSLVDPISYFPIIKTAVDRIVKDNPDINRFLSWASEKAASSGGTNSQQAVRAFFFGRAIDRNRALDLTIDLARDLGLVLNLNLDHHLALDLALDLAISYAHARTLTIDHVQRALGTAFKLKLPELENELQILLNICESTDSLWWQKEGNAWRESLRKVAIRHRNIGEKWTFSKDASKTLLEYYQANRMLIACLNAAPGLSAAMRHQIEESMLLPESELNKIANFEA